MSAGGYAEAYDPRRTGRVPLSNFSSSARYGASTALPLDLLFAVLLSKSLSALALHVTKDWVLASSGNSGWGAVKVNAVVMSVAAVAMGLWERSWEGAAGRGKRRSEPTSPLYSFLLVAETVFALLSISRLSILRFVILSTFAPLWARGMPFVKTGGRKAVGSSNALFITTGMIALSYVVDSTVSGGARRSGYLFALLHLFAAGQRSEIYTSYNGDERARGKMHANSMLAAAGLSVLHAALYSIFISPSTSASAPTSPAASAFFFPPASSLSLNLFSAALLALTYLVFDPLLTRALLSHFPPAKILSAGWPLAAVSTAFVGYVGFGRGIGIGEVAVGIVAWQALSHISATDPRSSFVSPSSGSAILATGSSTTPAPLLTRISILYRYTRSTIKTIVASPESKRIFYFLCLNLAYMFVQMVYGIWTNSLGLISDAIHMFFDCLALAMGLFASVMATWPSNEVYTYGYSRVETLSGFANGIFLCLISIFIVFEAIQRLLDPPEMNTGQLLTVSSVGLAVNLVGMMATGHAHGGHGHSHGGHSHGHGHGHAPVKTPVKSKSTPFLTETVEEEDDHHGHSHNGHSHSPSHSRAFHAATPPRPSASSHSHPQSHSHSPAPSPAHFPAASPAPSHSHSQAQSQPNTPAKSAAHDHSHAAPNHSHSHGGHGDHDSEDEDEHEGPKQSSGSHNMKGVFLHVLADTLGSVGVIVSTLLINWQGWTGFDPLASIFIACLIFASVVPLVIDAGRLLILDMGEEREEEVKKALAALNRIEGVSSFTKPRFWQKDPATMVGSICIQLAPAPGYAHTPNVVPKYFANIEKTTARVRRVLRANIGGLQDVVIQVEPTGGLDLTGTAGDERRV
ncbi:hypothetical protein JCM11641_005621 [Rhodosporidiobolus odoratus]